MKKILIIGKNGQVGWELQRTLAPLGQVQAIDYPELDLTNKTALHNALQALRPDVIVNAAAHTTVDQAEHEPERAQAINATAPAIMAETTRSMGALLVHYSTDHVYDGSGNTPFTEDMPAGPLNVYGHSKLLGDQAIQASGCRHLILRTSWVYGLRGRNFLLTMLRLAREHEELKVVDDQIGAPTWSRMIAEATALALARPTPVEGLYHCASSSETSWHGFTAAILELTRAQRTREPRLIGIPGSAYPAPARRPANSRLSCARLTQAADITLPHWREALALCLAQ
ncbi:dTDP-4-dehydrorhamnose reductase subunit, NAD(P)-binding, of dTDP-L-rhamnose synthase [Sterolibacterium denitrificans]|uniref:dTDP-4-dehydrorhamnose reductase n=1 Tax=Sterolibacterium denitrificans TaxID=157592 RepID=A0A7Z7HQT9_9PROT|nr:dTDP-4-dehydrorhamnose reductase [Sterolibacterium denitrificans]SMB24325.1 dTDP-4-dehydrorhamnose reductase subunit, NAD(P)-binding, of dTDP-L-rhamnose synthase [Sterolibacterium denitrificans]